MQKSQQEIAKVVSLENEANLPGVFSRHNPFVPEFLKWVHPSLNLDTCIVANRGLVKNQ